MKLSQLWREAHDIAVACRNIDGESLDAGKWSGPSHELVRVVRDWPALAAQGCVMLAVDMAVSPQAVAVAAMVDAWLALHSQGLHLDVEADLVTQGAKRAA